MHAERKYNLHLFASELVLWYCNHNMSLFGRVDGGMATVTTPTSTAGTSVGPTGPSQTGSTGTPGQDTTTGTGSTGTPEQDTITGNGITWHTWGGYNLGNRIN